MASSMVLRASHMARLGAARVWWDVGGACLDGARYGPARALWRSLYLGLTLARRRTPVFLVRGRGAVGGELSLAVAGSRKLVAELAELVLAGPSETRLEGRTLLDRPRTLAAGADLEATFVHPWHATRWVRAGWHVSPWRLRFELDLRSPWRAAAGRDGRSVANNLRRAERAGFAVEEVAAAGALPEFRARMVVPYARRRFGIRASSRIGRSARGGTILFIVRDGVQLAGGLVVPRGDRLHFPRLGVLDGRTELVREGVLAALYARTIEWGRARGFRTLDAGLACASAADGVHRWKVRWGFVPRDTPLEDRIALRARTDAGRRALASLAFPDAAQERG